MTQTGTKRTSRITNALAGTMLTVMALACGDSGSDSDGDDTTMGVDGGDDNTGGSMSEPSGDSITEAVLAACPQSATLMETTEWPVCVEGRSIKGTEPFNNMACELKIGKNGVFEYYRGGTLALSVPDRSMWGDAFGTYSNEDSAGRRAFLASISPDLPAVEGQARVKNITIGLYSEDIVDDSIKVEYYDAAFALETYNCAPDVL